MPRIKLISPVFFDRVILGQIGEKITPNPMKEELSESPRSIDY